MDYQAVKKDIDAGRIASCYFFFGEESYYIDILTALLVQKTVVPETRDFNCDVLQAEETDVGQALSAAASFPMMAERRIVVLKSVQKLTPTEKESLLAYVKRPNETTCLVLTAGKIDRRQTFYASLVQNTVWAEFKPLYDNQAVQWVEALFRDKGMRISTEAAGLLVRLTGPSLWNLANETEKTITFCWGKKSVDPGDIAAVAGFSRKYNSWELSDSVGRKKFDSAVNVLHRLMQEKPSPAGLVMELSRRIILLMRIRALLDRKESSDAIRARLGLNPYFSKMYIEQASCHTLAELESANLSLLGADAGIKTGTLDPLLALTLALHDLVCGETRGRFFS
jgi:DNA polymerase III subunit delta